jgi:hypothetical protein
MPKTKASKKPARKAAAKATVQPANCTVGLPDVPSTYGLTGQHHLPFAHAESRLASSRNYWICTARPDGRPHSIPVWGFWSDGVFYFGTARTSRKARNLTHNSAVSIHLESGDDVVILEGTATELDLADTTTIKRLDAASREKYKMPLVVMPEVVLYSVRPRTVLAWTE